jgi:hypothetical protein
MTYDPEKRRACRKRYYDTHREQCREASRSWKNANFKERQTVKARQTTWEQRRAAILAMRDEMTHRYSASMPQEARTAPQTKRGDNYG